MKELKEFTVEQLERLIHLAGVGCAIYESNTIAAIAKIALAAKQVRTGRSQCVKCGGEGMMDSGGTQPWGEPISIECDCTTPPLNHAEQDGWIKCSDRNPSDNGVYICWDGRLVKTYAFLFGNWQANQFIAPNITHWMHRPAAPKPEM